MSIHSRNKNVNRYFSRPENASKVVAHGNAPKKNGWWFMEELSRYQKDFILATDDDYPILVEAKFKKNGKVQIERRIFSTVDSAICFVKDAGLDRHRLSIVSKKYNMSTIIEVFVRFEKHKITYTYRLEDETFLTTSTDITDFELSDSLFCVYSVPNGKPYKYIPYE